MASDDAAPADRGPDVADASTIEPGELYVVVRKAVEDAILGVIGTLLLVGIGLVLIWFGIAMAATTYDANVVSAVAGLFVVLVGLYLAASALGVVPAVSDLL